MELERFGFAGVEVIPNKHDSTQQQQQQQQSHPQSSLMSHMQLQSQSHSRSEVKHGTTFKHCCCVRTGNQVQSYDITHLLARGRGFQRSLEDVYDPVRCQNVGVGHKLIVDVTRRLRIKTGAQ